MKGESVQSGPLALDTRGGRTARAESACQLSVRDGAGARRALSAEELTGAQSARARKEVPRESAHLTRGHGTACTLPSPAHTHAHRDTGVHV